MSCGSVVRLWLLIFTIFLLFVFARENISWLEFVFVSFLLRLASRKNFLFVYYSASAVSLSFNKTWRSEQKCLIRCDIFTFRRQERTILIALRKRNKFAVNGSARLFGLCVRWLLWRQNVKTFRVATHLLLLSFCQRECDKAHPHKSWSEAIKSRPFKSLSLTCRCVFKPINHFSPQISFQIADAFEASLKAIIFTADYTWPISDNGYSRSHIRSSIIASFVPVALQSRSRKILILKSLFIVAQAYG